MSNYLNPPDNLLTSTSLESIAHSYILNDLRSFIDKNIFAEKCFVMENGKELIQKMLDNSNYKLRMYGSADELAESLKIYQNFPNSYRFFKTEYEPYTTTATIYQSLKNEQYVCKSDLFVILQNMALDIFPSTSTVSVRLSILSSLRADQNKSFHRQEFVKFDQKVFDEIEMEMREARNNCFFPNAEYLLLGVQLAAGDFESLVEKFKKAHMKDKLTKGETDGIRKSLKDYYNKLKGRNPNPAAALAFFLVKTATMTCLQKIITVKKPELFLPNTKSFPTIVRLFEDGDQKFVMESELAIAMFPKRGSQIFLGRGNVGFHDYTTLTMEEAIQQGGKNIEFIRYPIQRAQHRAVPINGPDPEDSNDWCILAVDAFFEYMKSFITGFQIFQRYGTSANSFDYFDLIFSALENLFRSDRKSPYFLQIESVNYTLTQLQNCMKSVTTAKIVRNAKSDGFTLQNLKNELNHMDLTGIFPEIQNYAEKVYEKVDKCKKGEFLRTCDLIDAVENCQLICVLNRAPNLKNFLHNQKGCGRVLGYKCDECDKEKLETSQEPIRELKASELQNQMRNPKIKNSNKQIPNQISQPALSASQFCEKCSESSESLMKTQNELKISQDQLKEMEKKALNTENTLNDLKKNHEESVASEAKKAEELSKLTEELNEEKEKNQEKEEEILKATQENEELQKTILKLTTENETNERVIQQLLDRITNLSISNQENRQNDTPPTSLASKNVPLIIDCLICSNQIKSGEEVIRCPLCKRRFHSDCAFKWRKDHTQCPACNGDVPGF